MWDNLLLTVLRLGVRTGRLRLTLADVTVHDIGPGGAPEVAITLHDPTLPRRLMTYFQKVYDLMPPEGVALIHYIGRWSPPNTISPWFNKYIFPGAYCAAISESMRAVERTGLMLADLEVWRGHYERTLQEWLKRFDRNIDRFCQLQDERFVRL